MQHAFGLPQKPAPRIIVLGLDAAGKTTMLYQIKLGKVIETIPTIGMNVESLESKRLSFTAWDVGGRTKIRALWRHYFKGAEGLIFVVDCNDRDRIGDACHELEMVLSDDMDDMKEAVLLVFANKQDLPNAMTASEVTSELGLHGLQHRQWHVQPSCATSGKGLSEGIDWLSSALMRKQAGYLEDDEANGLNEQLAQTSSLKALGSRSLMSAKFLTSLL
mmetsp:Transcript_11264/g.12546  ORF Transcript_11264/g.12546 Transcript_11264/m.12546 type:complete len:219 (-) Transcript_11264:117-773(-)